jgi:hypothetical protein
MQRLRILVLGYIVRCPLGGMFWHYAQYMLGFHEMGHDVWLFEDSEDYPCCYDPAAHETTIDPDFGLRFLGRSLSSLGLADRWAYFDAHHDRWHGPAAERRRELFESADVLINVSGANPVRPWMGGVPHRVYVDTDPIFEQIRQLTVPERRRRADAHNHFFTFGEAVAAGTADCPDDGWPWRATRQPIVLSAWPLVAGNPSGPFTTVMQWDSYPAPEYHGRRYGMKSESFQPYVDLPGALPEVRLQLALGSPHAPRSLLASHGWELRDPLETTRDPWTYQRYLRESAAEWSVAKHGYVAGRSGWFSERSAAYLASGRPVLAQDTGFSGWIETGTGLISFNDFEAAAEGARRIRSDYRRHSEAARDIAETYFDSSKVLTELLEQISAGREGEETGDGIHTDRKNVASTPTPTNT